MDVRQLRAFATIAARGSITAASRELYIGQPALSRQLAALERTLGVRLFDRRPDGVELTEAGQRFLTDVEAVLTLCDALAPPDSESGPGSAVEPEPAAARPLVVAFTVSIGRGLMPAVAERLEQSGSAVTFSLRQVWFRDRFTHLVAGQVDAVLAWLPLETTLALRHETLLREPRLLALPPGHRLTGYDEVPFSELLDEPFLALPASLPRMRSYWLAEELRGGHPARIGATVNGPDETIEALAQGLGVAFITSGNAAIYRRPEFVTRPVSGLSPAELAVVWREDEDRPAVRDFVRACREAAVGLRLSGSRG